MTVSSSRKRKQTSSQRRLLRGNSSKQVIFRDGLEKEVLGVCFILLPSCFWGDVTLFPQLTLLVSLSDIAPPSSSLVLSQAAVDLLSDELTVSAFLYCLFLLSKLFVRVWMLKELLDTQRTHLYSRSVASSTKLLLTRSRFQTQPLLKGIWRIGLGLIETRIFHGTEKSWGTWHNHYVSTPHAPSPSESFFDSFIPSPPPQDFSYSQGLGTLLRWEVMLLLNRVDWYTYPRSHSPLLATRYDKLTPQKAQCPNLSLSGGATSLTHFPEAMTCWLGFCHETIFLLLFPLFSQKRWSGGGGGSLTTLPFHSAQSGRSIALSDVNVGHTHSDACAHPEVQAQLQQSKGPGYFGWGNLLCA